MNLHKTAALDNQAPGQMLEWLKELYPGQLISPDTSLERDLGVDSMDWLHLALEIRRRWGIDIDGAAISRIATLRDLLREVAARPPLKRAESAQATPLEHPEEFLGEERRYWLEPLGRAELAAAWCLYACNWLLVHAAFRLRVRGRERLPESGPFVLAPRHMSYLDPFVLAAVLSFPLLRRTYWAAWTGVAFGATFRPLRRLTHVVPVDSSWGAASSLAYAAAVLRRRQNLVWFPEGRLSQSGDLLELKPGTGLLLARYPLPVVPVYLQGTGEALPPGRKLPRPRPIDVVFGAPLDSRQLVEQEDGNGGPARIISALYDAFSRIQET